MTELVTKERLSKARGLSEKKGLFQEGLGSNKNSSQAHTQGPATSNEVMPPNHSVTEIDCPVQLKATQNHMIAFPSYFSFDRKVF